MEAPFLFIDFLEIFFKLIIRYEVSENESSESWFKQKIFL